MSPVREARTRAKLSIYGLAERVGLDPSTVSRIERGLQRTTPANAEKLAQALGISEEQVLYPERFAVKRKRKN